MRTLFIRGKYIRITHEPNNYFRNIFKGDKKVARICNREVAEELVKLYNTTKI